MPFEGAAEIIGRGISENMRYFRDLFTFLETPFCMVHPLSENIFPRGSAVGVAEELTYVIIRITQLAKLLRRADLQVICIDMIGNA